MIKFVTTKDTNNVNAYWVHRTINPFTVDWGDGVVETLTDTGKFKHKYKKKGQYNITIHDLDFPDMKMTECKWLEEVHGTIKHVNDLWYFFADCPNLIYVDEDFLNENTDHEFISSILSGASKIRDITFVTHLRKVLIADFAFQGCECADLNVLAGWGKNLIRIDGMFMNRKYGKAPNENILSAMRDLISAKALFANNHNMTECPLYFKRNRKLQDIYNAFSGCNIKKINKNWFSHLSNTVKTSKYEIFDSTVEINY